jgi:predicted AlkP superfamily phosphohydrolase/phosphomutase
VRINVAGRDGDGGIALTDFAAVCDELTAMIGQLVATRTGEPAVAEVIRVREEADQGKDLSPADLIIRWRDHITGDVMDHPDLGRVGPVPYFRAGGHAMKGFMLGVGPSFRPDQRLPDVTTQDVTATILDRLGLPKPAHMTGTAIERAAAEKRQSSI